MNIRLSKLTVVILGFVSAACSAESALDLVTIKQPTFIYDSAQEDFISVTPQERSTEKINRIAAGELLYRLLDRSSTTPIRITPQWIELKILERGVHRTIWIKSEDVSTLGNFRRVRDCWPIKKVSGPEGEDPFVEAKFNRHGDAVLEFAGGVFLHGSVFMAGDAVFVAEQKSKHWEPVYSFAFDRHSITLLPDGMLPVEPTVAFSAVEMKGCKRIRLSGERINLSSPGRPEVPTPPGRK